MCVMCIHLSRPEHVKAEHVDPSPIPLSFGSPVDPAVKVDLQLWALHFSKPSH